MPIKLHFQSDKLLLKVMALPFGHYHYRKNDEIGTSKEVSFVTANEFLSRCNKCDSYRRGEGKSVKCVRVCVNALDVVCDFCINDPFLKYLPLKTRQNALKMTYLNLPFLLFAF